MNRRVIVSAVALGNTAIAHSFYSVRLLVIHAFALLLNPAIASKTAGNWAVALLSVDVALLLAIISSEMGREASA
jgi:hypothetical protein